VIGAERFLQEIKATAHLNPPPPWEIEFNSSKA
jgi:hypothetical protein